MYEDLVEENLDCPIIGKTNPCPSSSTFHVADLEFVEAYQDDPRAFSYIWENLNFCSHSRTYDIRFLVVNNGAEMVQKDKQGLDSELLSGCGIGEDNFCFLHC